MTDNHSYLPKLHRNVPTDSGDHIVGQVFRLSKKLAKDLEVSGDVYAKIAKDPEEESSGSCLLCILNRIKDCSTVYRCEMVYTQTHLRACTASGELL
jgi:hypothetical protein